MGRLEVICQRYDQISEMLTDINVLSDVKKVTALAKEQKSLEKIVFNVIIFTVRNCIMNIAFPFN